MAIRQHGRFYVVFSAFDACFHLYHRMWSISRSLQTQDHWVHHCCLHSFGGTRTLKNVSVMFCRIGKRKNWQSRQRLSCTHWKRWVAKDLWLSLGIGLIQFDFPKNLTKFDWSGRNKQHFGYRSIPKVLADTAPLYSTIMEMVENVSQRVLNLCTGNLLPIYTNLRIEITYRWRQNF